MNCVYTSRVKTDKAARIGAVVFGALLMLVALGPASIHPGSHGDEPGWQHPLVRRDLDAIRDDTLRVLVLRDPLSWEEHPGAIAGLEWELLERFARHEKLRIDAVPVDHPDSMLLMLQRGDGDVMAAQLCPDGWARGFVAFTDPYRTIAPLRIALNSDAMVRTTRRSRHDPGTPDTIAVSRWSPFCGLKDPFDTAYAPITLVPDTALPENLLARVALGQCRAALVVDAVSSLEARRMPHVAFGPRLGRSIPLAFGIRSNGHALLHALNHWLAQPRELEARALITESYGEGRLTKGPLRTLRELEFSTDSISPFDSLFQAHADSSAFDWELLAAVGFKESRFDTSAVSHAGASGLMQIMPATAQALGVDSADGVDGHIGGAIKYLDKLDAMWRGTVPNKDQRLKFVLASYNAGPGHIKDAQRLAEDLGLDPHRWDGSVERTLLLLAKPRWFTRPDMKNGYCRGHETFWYVRDVVAAFGQYTRK